MRNLLRNMTTIWIVNPASVVDETDINGFYTGQKIKVYGTPQKISIALYPSDGRITQEVFGKDASLDMIAVSNTIVLQKDTMLYYSMPTSNFDKTYDYKVSLISKSLNTYNYGLKART